MRTIHSIAVLVSVLAGTTHSIQQHREQHHLVSNKAVAWVVSKKVFKQYAATAFCIAGYETGHTYNPTVVSPTNDHGEWQINAQHVGHTMRSKVGSVYISSTNALHNIWFNAHVAYVMSNGGRDWSQWTTHSLCGV